MLVFDLGKPYNFNKITLTESGIEDYQGVYKLENELKGITLNKAKIAYNANLILKIRTLNKSKYGFYLKYTYLDLYPEADSNCHAFSSATPSRWCVCQFRHPGIF